ncbi:MULTISPECIES: T6SS phospholipase effector Tle1-like catalytic domain-containing protein [Paraburkholderia]|uniref:T6SS phospholipase effector Tle1-like catalytic domain-containing protein n=1 Tax=Paraburkholderia TaxID=1822464 RepID=UPI003218743B
MTVCQAGAPVSDAELGRAAARGIDRRLTAEYSSQAGRSRALCRLYPKLSFFFDGTGNNLYQELEKPEHEQALSNVAKLYLAAINDPVGQGATPRYIPGVGTPFRIARRDPDFTGLLRDDRGGTAGLGMGLGGSMRIDWALAEFAMILEKDWSPQAQQHMQYISLAVFGFSRGATEARAFVRQLLARCVRADGELYWAAKNLRRIPLRITFLGLFDTVASVGGPSLHLDWAAELAVPPEVERCVHYVAAHEVRQAFPLDSVRVGRAWPANSGEVVYPGVHSDVGGGYAPDVQGRSNLLSRIPLRHMYAEALQAGVPLWSLDKLPVDRQASFVLANDDPVVALYQDYMETLPAAENDVEALIQAHRRLLFQWRGALERRGDDARVLGRLYGQPGVSASACLAVPAATDQDHPECAPSEWTYAIPRSPEKQAVQLLGEQRRLVERIAFLRNPVEGNHGNRDWPPPSPRQRTAYEDLILSAWDTTAAVSPAVDGLLAEHVHDSVAHFTSWPCALYDPRGVYCDQVRYYAARPWLGQRPVVVT